jgi:hypothetical protein
MFVQKNHLTLARSAWGPLVQRAGFYTPARVDAGAVNWATDQIIEFIKQEEVRGAALAVQVQQDPGFTQLLANEPNLMRRIMYADPPPVP